MDEKKKLKIAMFVGMCIPISLDSTGDIILDPELMKKVIKTVEIYFPDIHEIPPCTEEEITEVIKELDMDMFLIKGGE